MNLNKLLTDPNWINSSSFGKTHAVTKTKTKKKKK